MKTVLPDDIEKIVETLKEGKVVAFPTDTVYGLLADATNEKAVQRVFEMKGREQGKALPVFVKDIHMAKEFAEVSDEQKEFLKKSWPGKITAVLKSKHALPKALEVEDKIALRIPDYELVQRVIEELNRPVTGTSANVSGQPSCRSAEEIVEQFKDKDMQPDLIVDGGQLSDTKPSRIIDITGETHIIIRT